MIVVNGSPKTGTNLLLKTVVMFGAEAKLAIHDHIPYSRKSLDAKYLHITRSPRNVVASWVRFNKLELNEKNYIDNIPYIVQEMSEYIGWMTDADTLHIKFEELLTDSTQIDRIGAYIGLPPITDHWLNIWGGTPTFTNSLSVWRDFWTPGMAVEWVKNGGIELENVLGYDPSKEWVREI